uniref:Uncharacterized protein n=1 Tax=Cucumis sativus TaxID=3659 RepID=A0A0A0L3P4_CUCSA
MPGPIGSAVESVIPRSRFTDNSSRAEQLSRTAFMPLAPNVQDPQESFFKPLQFLAKAAMPTSVNSRHARSLRRVKLRHRREMRISESSRMLVDLRSHFKASLVTASNRVKREGIIEERSASALRERR